MTVNTSRSQNAELFEGMTDGTYKKLITDRGGFIDPLNPREKSLIAPQVYGLVGEVKQKILPDGRTKHTPNTREPQAQV